MRRGGPRRAGSPGPEANAQAAVHDVSEQIPSPALCGRCGSDACHPVVLVADTDGDVRATMRCPVCFAVRRERFAKGVLDRFAKYHEAGLAEIRRALAVAERESFMADAARFARLLAADAILPEDF